MTSVDEDRAKAAKLAEFNKQFQRSDASPLKENQAPRVALDGAAVLAKYAGSDSVTSMTGAEYYAMIGHIKRQHGHKGESLEVELMKITRQMDKKIRLLDWINENIAKPSAPAPAPQRAASPLVSRQAEAPVDISEHAAAGTPSKRGESDFMPHRSTMPQISRLDLGNMGGEERIPGDAPRPQTASGAQTARARTAMLGGDGMADLLGGTTPRGAPPMTARPSTAAGGGELMGGGAPPPSDMSPVIASYCMGKEHLKMSGQEYYQLLSYLRANGHTELEGDLLKVRTMGDKKLHLVRYIKEKCSHLAGGSAPVADAPLSHRNMAGHETPREAYNVAPTQMGQAQVLQIPQQPQIQQQLVAQQQQQLLLQQQMAAQAAAQQAALQGGAMHSAAMQQQAITQAVATIQQAAAGQVGLGGGQPFVASVLALEATLGRLDESFSFAVECMQTDMAAAKAELAKLKAMLPAN